MEHKIYVECMLILVSVIGNRQTFIALPPTFIPRDDLTFIVQFVSES